MRYIVISIVISLCVLALWPAIKRLGVSIAEWFKGIDNEEVDDDG